MEKERVVKNTSGSEFRKFDDVVRRILSVSHKELEKRERQYHADSIEALRREAPVDGHRALELLQGVDERPRRCAHVEQGIPRGRQVVLLQDTVFLHIELQKTFVLFEPLAEG